MSAVARRCLVLNANGVPLRVWPPSLIPSEDAVHALCRDRVNVIENWPNEFFHSPSISIPVPKVVMLRNYAPVDANPKFCRRSIFLRDRYCCQYCGKKFPTELLTFDHVVPRSKGGKTTWDNILTACLSCNGLKSDQDANMSGKKGAAGSLRPLKMPRRPSTTELLRAGMDILPPEVRENWSDYLYWNTELQA